MSGSASRELSERLNLLPNDLYASFVRGIELQDSVFVHIAEQLPRSRKDRAGFSSSWRSVEQQIWKVTAGHTLSQHLDNFALLDYFLHCSRPTGAQEILYGQFLCLIHTIDISVFLLVYFFICV